MKNTSESSITGKTSANSQNVKEIGRPLFGLIFLLIICTKNAIHTQLYSETPLKSILLKRYNSLRNLSSKVHRQRFHFRMRQPFPLTFKFVAQVIVTLQFRLIICAYSADLYKSFHDSSSLKTPHL